MTNVKKSKKSGQARKLGVRTIDVSAVRRMLTWSIDHCERQLQNLRSALEVIDGVTNRQ